MIPLPPTPPSSSTLFDWCRKVAGLINQLINRQTFTQLATAPTNPRPGDGWFDTGSNIAYIWDGTSWVPATGGGGGGGGTVTSVAATVPTGFSITGSPITTSGTLAISYSAGYQGYTSAESTKLAGIAPGATANTGTVTSVAFSGGTTGLTVSGSPITTSGTITLSGALVVANGGTGATTLTGYVKGSGTSPFTASATIPGSDISGNITGNAANVTGTVAVANGGTGATTFTAGYLKASAATPFTTVATIPGSDITGAALTKTDDTNVTLTLGGTPATALLRATSLTLGWTGQLSVARGGTGVAASTGTTAVVLSNLPQFTSTIGVGAAASASGSGVSFPATQSASTDPNTLDDYEEGTWTPVVTAGSGTITSYTASGQYTKVGRLVTATFSVSITNNGTGAGALVVTLPFTNNSGSTYFGCGRESNTTGSILQAEVANGSTSAFAYTYNNGYPGGTGNAVTCTVTYAV